MLLNTHGLLGPGLGKRSHSRPPVAASAPAPPGSPLHWFDFSDLTQLFQDELQATPVTANGQEILSITNKGTSSEFMSIEAEGPVYNDTGIPTLNTGAATFDAAASLKTVISDVVSGTWEHYSSAIVVSSENVEAFAAAVDWDTFESSWATAGSDNMAWYTQNTEPVSGTTGLVNDTFYSFLATNDDEVAPEASVVQQSHSTSVVNADTELADGPAAGDILSFGEASASEGSQFAGHIVEWITWDAILSAGEIADYKTYVTAKYGIAWA